METKKLSRTDIAQLLLDIKALALSPKEPFTWASGIKAPIYCDNRLVLAYPEVRDQIINAMVGLIKEKELEFDVVVGTATAGIPHAAWLSQVLELPMAYVRSSQKEHGKQNQIEGLVKKQAKVIVIEDLISTGKSSINCIKALEDAGHEVVGVMSIFTYNLGQGIEAFDELNIPTFSLTDFDALIQLALEKNEINGVEHEDLQTWRNRL